MTEMTNPPPSDPSGASAMPQDSHLVNGSQELLDAASTGTDEGPAGVPANLAGVDRDGDPVAPPPAALPGDAGLGAGPAEEGDPLSPADTANPLTVSAGRGDSADAGTASSSSSGGAPTGVDSVRGGSAT